MNEKYLTLVIEECAEVIQACTKTRRFGLDSSFGGSTNYTKLTQELGDLLCVVGELIGEDEATIEDVLSCANNKKIKLAKWGPEVCPEVI